MFPGIDPDYKKAKLFSANSTTSIPSVVDYVVPPGARALFIFGAGAGAGGGGGASGASGTTRGGAGGTSTTGLVHALVPTALIPDLLLVRVGYGGLGGAADTNGTVGDNTGIWMPQRFRSNTVNLISFGRASPGLRGTTTSFGNGANFEAPTVAFPAIMLAFSLSGGANGGAHTGGSPGSSGGGSSSSSMSTGGGGVGTNDVSFASGSVTVSNFFLPAATSGSGYNGRMGFCTDPLSFNTPFIRCGSTGGASNGTGTGGNGADGALTCSGAGGGGGVTGGRGGNGGNGFLVIIPIY